MGTETAATTLADITTAMVTAVTSVASEALSGIAKIVPVALPIAGGILLVRILWRSAKASSR